MERRTDIASKAASIAKHAAAGTLLALASFALRAQTNPTLPADTVLLDGKIWTGEPYLPAGHKAVPSKIAQAVAILNGRFVAVGTDAEIRPLIGPHTKVIDLHGRMAMPGFIDAHVHFVVGSNLVTQLYLKDVKNETEFVAAIAARAKTMKPGQWILGGNWDESTWPGAKLPTHELIDAVTPDNPVYLRRYDGHEAIMNTLAMKLAGITATTKVPVGGTILKDASGQPTGLIKDSVRDIIDKAIPPPTPTEFEAAVRTGLDQLRKNGVTSVGDMNYGQLAPTGSPADLIHLLHRAELEGWLTARFYSIIPLTDIKLLTDLGASRGFGSDMLRVGALKTYADGSIGSRSGWFFQDYDDQPGFKGLPRAILQPRANMDAAVKTAIANGYQLNTHAVGDRANAETLDAIEQSAGPNPAQYRFRIEHAQHVRPQDFARFAKLGVIASMQPYHVVDDGRFVDARIGRKRSESSYAWRSMLDAGATLAFGTDWPIAPINPMLGLYAAVTRITNDGKNPGGWIPSQRITLEEALRAYTQASAFAEFQENNKGTITPGKLADIIVLSDDLFAIPPAKIPDTRVLLTILGGESVYTASPF
jgi:predicted amidohydrolase YtcJ